MSMTPEEARKYAQDKEELYRLATHIPGSFTKWMYSRCVDFKEAAVAALRFHKSGREDPGKMRDHLMKLRQFHDIV